MSSRPFVFAILLLSVTKKKLEIFHDGVDYPDLTSYNKHLLHSKFMRNFITAIYTLTYLGYKNKFSTQFTSDKFQPHINKMPWKPWYHIYSGKIAFHSNTHHPTYNRLGKYIVRLYWMGTWRKIYVDDKIPVDNSNTILLPSSPFVDKEKEAESETNLKTEKIPKKGKGSQGSKGSKDAKRGKGSKDTKRGKGSKTRRGSEISKASKENTIIKEVIETKKIKHTVVELWPFLLSKALLKIASLSWSEDKELVDFDIIQCFTGWIPHRINTQGCPEMAGTTKDHKFLGGGLPLYMPFLDGPSFNLYANLLVEYCDVKVPRGAFTIAAIK